ncbi:MAG: SPOR domain-containing protein [Treponema sp.]|nr:SPOR domain-containing protein [Treponema sp.]
MKKRIAVCAVCAACVLFCAHISAETAAQLRDNALSQLSVQESISYLKANLEKCAAPKDRRSVLYFTGTLQEQLGLYSDASANYAKAAGIAAGDADGMPKVSAEHLVLDAVRTALCAGEYDTADSYLNSAVRSSKDEAVRAYVNLYSVWSALCRAASAREAEDSVSILKAYSTMQSMRPVRPGVLLTLWYLTDEKEYADALRKEFPKSPEAGIVSGTVQIMSVPFWYFVPRAEHSAAEAYPSSSAADTGASSSAPAKTNPKGRRQQLGLFRNEANAAALIERLKSKGFDGYFYTETRASGTTYYIVVVDENAEGNMGLRLRDAGFECYEVE